jgi:hypothetical protein
MAKHGQTENKTTEISRSKTDSWEAQVTFYIYSPYFHQVADSGDDVPVKKNIQLPEGNHSFWGAMGVLGHSKLWSFPNVKIP